MGKLFLGKYNRTLDEKGRLQLPAKLIGENKGPLYMLKGYEGCIAVYPEKQFEEQMEKLSELDWNDESNRAYIRLATSSVNEMKVDSHGRILIGREVLDDYQLDNEVTVIGVLDHFEIWDATAYAKYILAHGSSYESLAPRRKA